MPSGSSSHGSMPKVTRYDVFISFRGETRTNFTSHLHAALKRAYLEVFHDAEKLEKGDEITPSLIQAIKDSNISVIVFSEHYASSKWCLGELHQIMQYRNDEGQCVIPIFYKVDPGDVRNQTGAYKEAFEKHEVNHQHDPDKVNRWRAALSKAGNLSGWECKTSTDESKLIQEIVAVVSTKLERISNCLVALNDVIAIDAMIEPIESLLEKSHKVGIWGMGGVGKTTMAKALFVKLSCRFDNWCFLENVREKTKRNGLEDVRNSLISMLLGQDMQNKPSNAFMKPFVARRLANQKALVVLDDVYSSEQLKDLLGNACNLLRKGSKVIITTRDKKLLKGEGYEIHEAKGLSFDNSRRLFIRKAFRSDCPKDGFEQLIKGFVDYTQNNPLAIQVLGSYVFSEDKDFWDELLKKLPESPCEEIQQVLRLSFDGLDYDQKQIFLDIGCFLKGESEIFVKELLQSYGFCPITGLKTLNDKALIVTTNGKIEMHDLIQKMAYQIVREESRNKPGKRSRLWDSCEIHDVLNNCEGEEEVEGIMVNIHRIRPLHMTAETFNKTPKIRFLKFYSIWDSFISNIMRIETSLESISTKMRYFHWEGYPGRSLPSNFCAEFLLEVNLEHSHVETLWEGKKDLANLRRLKLGNCTKLRELPDFSDACKLKIVDLSGCCSLSYVHESVLSHDSLASLSLKHCSNLERLRSSRHLKSLGKLDIFGCIKMKEFCVSSEELTSLDLSKTLIEELKPSIGRCSKLRTLNLLHTKLKRLPIQVLSRLTSLEELRISDLEKIDSVKLRVLFDSLRSLRSLSLVKCCGLIELPDNITQLSRLKELSLTDCRNLRCLPKLPPSLELLDVQGCTARLFDSSSIDHLSNLNRLCLNTSSLGQCPLTKLCDFKLLGLRIHSYRQRMEEANLEAVFDALRYLEMLCLEEWPHLTKLPSNVRHLSKLNYLSVKGCTELLSLPELPPSLRSLIATNCTSLATLSPSTISRTPQNKGKKFFSFINCENLDVRAIKEQASWLLEKAVHEKEDVAVYYRGKKVPKWFGNNRSQNDSDWVKLSLSTDNLMGFIFCIVILDSVPKENCLAPSIIFGVKEDQTAALGQCFPMPEDSRGYVLLGSNPLEVSPGSVLLCSNPALSEKILEKIEGYRRNHEATTSNQTLFFKFTGEQKYGVYPIYASECSGRTFIPKKPRP